MKKQKPNRKSKMSLAPLGDRVLIRPIREEEINKRESFGIIIPDTVSKDVPEKGEVLAVGPGRLEDGKRIAISIKKGDKVIFSKYSYEEVNIGEEKLYILKEDNILAVIEN